MRSERNSDLTFSLKVSATPERESFATRCLLTLRLSHLSSLLADRKRRATTSALSPNNQTRRNAMPYLSKLDSCRSAKNSIRLLALSLSLAVAAPTVFAQDWDHNNGRDKDHDPTGAWLIRNDASPPDSSFILTVFHKGGTLTGDIQGRKCFRSSSYQTTNAASQCDK
jgi:hypothetical protein